MSDNLTAFLRRAETDPALRQRLEAISDPASEEALAQVAAIAAEEGTPVTVEELLAFRASLAHEAELSLDQLEHVAGGNSAEENERRYAYSSQFFFLQPHSRLADSLVEQNRNQR